jgi:phage-related protein
MENLKELFGELVEREVNSSVGAAESMKAVWAVVKDRNDPFSVAIRNVIVEKISDIRRAANGVLRFHKEVFHGVCPSDAELSDQLIDFLAAQEKQVKIAEEILREDLNLPTEP